MKLFTKSLLGAIFFLFSQFVHPQEQKKLEEGILLNIKGDVFSMDYEGKNKTQLTFTKGQVLAFTQFFEGGGIYLGVTNANDLDVYSLSFKDKAKAVFIAKLKAPDGYSGDFFRSGCFMKEVEMFIAQDKILAVTCDCAYFYDYASLYRLDVAKKFSRLYPDKEKLSKVKSTPFAIEKSPEAKLLEKNLYISGNDLFLKVDSLKKKQKISSINKITFNDNQGNPVKKASVDRFEVSPGGNFVIFDVVTSIGDVGHGESFAYNFKTGTQVKLSGDLLSEFIRKWEEKNDILFFRKENDKGERYICKLSPDSEKVERIGNTTNAITVEIMK